MNEALGTRADHVSRGGGIMALIGYLDELKHRLHHDQAMKNGFDFLEKISASDFSALGDGEVRRVAIDADRVFAMIQTYTTSADRMPKFEGHRRYLDIQFIFSGRESMLVASRRDCQSKVDYDPDSDVEFFHAPAGPASSLDVGPGMAAVFY